MNTQIAEILMRCHRSGRKPSSRVKKAVKFAEQNGDLQKALTGQMQFDDQIVGVIHYIKPPENLRQKLSELSGPPAAKRKGLFRQLIHPAVLTALVGVLLLAGVLAFFVKERMENFPGRERVEGLLGTAAKMTGQELEPVETTTGQLGDWLYMRGYEGYVHLPEVAKLPVVGSRVFRYDGRIVAQAAIDHHDSLYYQFDAGEFGVDLPHGADWHLLTKDAWVGAICQRGERCFLLAFRGTKPEMQDFLKNLSKK